MALFRRNVYIDAELHEDEYEGLVWVEVISDNEAHIIRPEDFKDTYGYKPASKEAQRLWEQMYDKQESQ